MAAVFRTMYSLASCTLAAVYQKGAVDGEVEYPYPTEPSPAANGLSPSLAIVPVAKSYTMFSGTPRFIGSSSTLKIA